MKLTFKEIWESLKASTKMFAFPKFKKMRFRRREMVEDIKIWWFNHVLQIFAVMVLIIAVASVWVFQPVLGNMFIVIIVFVVGAVAVFVALGALISYIWKFIEVRE